MLVEASWLDGGEGASPRAWGANTASPNQGTPRRGRNLPRASPRGQARAVLESRRWPWRGALRTTNGAREPEHRGDPGRDRTLGQGRSPRVCQEISAARALKRTEARSNGHQRKRTSAVKWQPRNCAGTANSFGLAPRGALRTYVESTPPPCWQLPMCGSPHSARSSNREDLSREDLINSLGECRPGRLIGSGPTGSGQVPFLRGKSCLLFACSGPTRVYDRKSGSLRAR